MIISRTPYRISFFGGGTDYPAWYKKHGGSVIAATIDKYCYLTCRYLPPFFEHRLRVVYSKIENCRTVDEIAHPAVREVLRFLKIDRGIEIHHDGDVPARSGLGSSSSFTVGLLHALYYLKRYVPNKRQLAFESIYIEQECINETVGSQDQISAAYGGFNHINFSSNDEIDIKPIPISQEFLNELNSHLMLFYTGIKRTASDVAESYVKNLGAKEKELHVMQEIVDEGLSILNDRRDLMGFGKLLNDAWEIKSRLSPIVSNPLVDDIYCQARLAGAVGGKLVGAGGGGFILVFVPPDKHKRVLERLNNLVHVPFEFEFSGSQIIFHNPQEDYAELDRSRSHQGMPKFSELKYNQIPQGDGDEAV